MGQSWIEDKECEVAGLDPKQVLNIARRLNKAAEDAAKLGLYIFGGSGTGQLRSNQCGEPPLVVARIGQGFDGGCGATHNDDEGLLRGE